MTVLWKITVTEGQEKKMESSFINSGLGRDSSNGRKTRALITQRRAHSDRFIHLRASFGAERTILAGLPCP